MTNDTPNLAGRIAEFKKTKRNEVSDISLVIALGIIYDQQSLLLQARDALFWISNHPYAEARLLVDKANQTLAALEKEGV